MKAVFSFQKNNFSSPQKQNIKFGAGLTTKMVDEIIKSDVLEISDKLAQKGIKTDFQNNKVVAWCSEKTIEIYEDLSKICGIKKILPNGIYFDDFVNLNVDNPESMGFCNFTETAIRKNSDENTQSKTIFFNTFESIKNTLSNEDKYLYSWDINDLDKAADMHYATKFMSIGHFLNPFIHEIITHVLHIRNLQKEIGGKAIVKKVESFKDTQQIEKINSKYESKLSQICNYALTNPLEAVACDMSRVIVGCLDKDTLMPIRNPFVKTPYEKLSLFKRMNIPYYTDEERPLIEILRNFWNGKFD